MISYQFCKMSKCETYSAVKFLSLSHTLPSPSQVSSSEEVVFHTPHFPRRPAPRNPSVSHTASLGKADSTQTQQSLFLLHVCWIQTRPIWTVFCLFDCVVLLLQVKLFPPCCICQSRGPCWRSPTASVRAGRSSVHCRHGEWDIGFVASLVSGYKN